MTERQFVTFYLGNDLFGVDILLVREINRNLDITPVDWAPAFVRGLLNLRGQIVTVLDLGARLGLGAGQIRPHSSVIVLKTAGELARSGVGERTQDSTSAELVGLLVDYIGDVVTVNASEIAPPPAHTGDAHAHYLSGVVKLDQRLLVTLKVSELLATTEAVAVR